ERDFEEFDSGESDRALEHFGSISRFFARCRYVVELGGLSWYRGFDVVALHGIAWTPALARRQRRQVDRVALLSAISVALDHHLRGRPVLVASRSLAGRLDERRNKLALAENARVVVQA